MLIFEAMMFFIIFLFTMLVVVHRLHDSFNDEANGEHVNFGLILVGLQKVNLCEVHAHRFRDEGF
jgi:hypothetical protein